MEDRDVEELHRIWELKERGAISAEEYAELKAKILERQTASATQGNAGPDPHPQSPISHALTPEPRKANNSRNAGLGCLVLVGFLVILRIIGSIDQPASSSGNATDIGGNSTAKKERGFAQVDENTSAWTYTQNEDKVRGGTTFYATTTSTNSISQNFPYDSHTTMDLTVRKSPAYGTDVILTVSSGQMMCHPTRAAPAPLGSTMAHRNVSASTGQPIAAAIPFSWSAPNPSSPTSKRQKKSQSRRPFTKQETLNLSSTCTDSNGIIKTSIT